MIRHGSDFTTFLFVVDFNNEQIKVTMVANSLMLAKRVTHCFLSSFSFISLSCGKEASLPCHYVSKSPEAHLERFDPILFSFAALPVLCSDDCNASLSKKIE